MRLLAYNPLTWNQRRQQKKLVLLIVRKGSKMLIREYCGKNKTFLLPKQQIVREKFSGSRIYILPKVQEESTVVVFDLSAFFSRCATIRVSLISTFQYFRVSFARLTANYSQFVKKLQLNSENTHIFLVRNSFIIATVNIATAISTLECE